MRRVVAFESGSGSVAQVAPVYTAPVHPAPVRAAPVRAAPWRRIALVLLVAAPFGPRALHMFHGLASLTLVAAAILPSAGLMIAFAFRRSRGRERRQAAMFALLALVLGTSLLVLGANQWLDRSPALRETYPVEGVAPGGLLARPHVQILPRTGGPLGTDRFAAGTEAIAVDPALVARIVPGETTVSLALHRGVFGFPWYEGRPFFDRLGPAR